MNDGEVRQFLGGRGVDVFTSTPEEFSAYLKSEAVKWTAILRSLAVKPVL
jgi:tripartite-type tricarboxylate transporter receptor subunit TctC